MSDEPSFDFLPWEELPVGVRRNRKKMYNYLVSVLGGDTPTPPGPTGTGTVTVTAIDESENPTSQVQACLSTVPITEPPQSADGLVAFGTNNSGNEVMLSTFDPQTFQPTGNDIPFGDYYIYVDNNDTDPNLLLKYSGELTVDGNETVTITLTSE